MASVGRPKKRIQLKSKNQVGEVQIRKAVQPVRLAPDEVVCPVCGYPAVALLPDGRPGQRFRHSGRIWDCSSDRVIVVYSRSGEPEEIR